MSSCSVKICLRPIIKRDLQIIIHARDKSTEREGILLTFPTICEILCFQGGGDSSQCLAMSFETLVPHHNTQDLDLDLQFIKIMLINSDFIALVIKLFKMECYSKY